MDPQRWSLMRHLFETAVELPESQWQDVLRGAGDDDLLRGEVLALLHADARLRQRERGVLSGPTSIVDILLQARASRDG